VINKWNAGLQLASDAFKFVPLNQAIPNVALERKSALRKKVLVWEGN